MKLIIQIIILSALFSNLKAQIVYVDIKNISGIEDGTSQHPYNSLEEGMQMATAGQTLLVMNGNYTPSGSFLYLKPGVRISGESKINTVILGELRDTFNSSLPVKIEKITFTDFSFNRPALINGQIPEQSTISECKCKNILIYHRGGFADQSYSNPGPIPYFYITANEVAETIRFGHGSGLIVGENVISGNKAGSIGLAHGVIKFTQAAPMPASIYRIENNDVTGDIFFQQGSGLNIPISVHNNKARSLQIASGGGFSYLITNNVLQEGYFDRGGANWTTFSNNTIVDGRIADSSGGPGDEVEDAVIENNSIFYRYQAGKGEEVISVTAHSVTLKNNTITGEGPVSGVRLSSGTPTNLTGNKIKLNNGAPVQNTFGVYTVSGKGEVTGNEISGGWYGYYSASGAHVFGDNVIKNCHHGLFSKGTEEVKNNLITGCSGHGMILNGIRGPVSGNTVTNNDSTGIWVIKTTDIGGGHFNGPGKNILRGNGYYDLRISSVTTTADTLYIDHNTWDHDTIADILKYDILNESTNRQLVIRLESVIPATDSDRKGFVITNERGLIDDLIAAGYGDSSLYRVMVFLRPSSGGSFADGFMTALAAAPMGSEVYTKKLNSVADSPVCLNSDGTIAATPLSGKEYYGKTGYFTRRENKNGAGRVFYTFAENAGYFMDAGSAGPGIDGNKAFVIAW